MILLLATYDIEVNKTRKKAADLLLSYGLYRVQKSVYFGLVPSLEVDELMSRIREVLEAESDGGKQDKFYLIPMSQLKFNEMLTIGEKPDLGLILRKCNTLIV